MNIEDMNDNDKKTKASKPFKSNGGSEPQSAKDQLMILRTEVKRVDDKVGFVDNKVDAVGQKVDKSDAKSEAAIKELRIEMRDNRKEAKADNRELLAKVDANHKETKDEIVRLRLVNRVIVVLLLMDLIPIGKVLGMLGLG